MTPVPITFQRPRLPRRRLVGFTLIELMIVVAVVAILAAIAYPSYRDYVRRSNRAAAQSFMMDLALRQQQMYLDTRRYAPTLDALRATVPDAVNGRYDIQFEVGTGGVPSYTLSAVPVGSQADDKGCMTLKILSSGERQATGTTPTKCW
jgi:type IV pilus assembly protein PilE